MCEFFVSADPILYESRTRTVRIRGVSTSIRMENFMWDTLAALAAEEGVTTNALIAQFHDEILRHRGDVLNFASFLRVTCLRYLRRKLDATENHKLGHQLGGQIGSQLDGPLDGNLLEGAGAAFPQNTH